MSSSSLRNELLSSSHASGEFLDGFFKNQSVKIAMSEGVGKRWAGVNQGLPFG